MCQDVSKDDIPEARKLTIFKEKVTIKTKVDSGHPNFKELSSETFEGELLDALIYAHQVNRKLVKFQIP